MLKWMCLITLLFSAACSEPVSTPATKVAGDPDAEFVGEKADNLSNRWTTIVGELTPNEMLAGEIDYPEWYHGYTIELGANATVDLELLTTADSLVRVYGPSYRTARDGRPLFRSSILKGDLTGDEIANLSFTSEDAGTYMVVLGPKYVWKAEYLITATTEQRCETAADCAAGQSCEHNGVYCITTPCDVSYNICKPAAGCTSDADCTDGWCAPTESGDRACKAFVAEGEGCGGFRPAHLNQACTPDMQCVAPYDIIADIPGSCSLAETTVAELLTNPATYSGHHVVVRGAFVTGFGYCTKMACPIENPCCNSCGAELMLADSVDAVPADAIQFTDDGNTLGCSGNECNFLDNCDATLANVWVSGWFNYDDATQTGSMKITRHTTDKSHV
ncbi:MAG: hypothetical protein R3E66_05825 [bacterium]